MNTIVVLLIIAVAVVLLLWLFRVNSNSSSSTEVDENGKKYDGSSCDTDADCVNGLCTQEFGDDHKKCYTPPGGQCNQDITAPHKSTCSGPNSDICARSGSAFDSKQVCCPSGNKLPDPCTGMREFCTDILEKGEICRHNDQCKSGYCTNVDCGTGRCS